MDGYVRGEEPTTPTGSGGLKGGPLGIRLWKIGRYSLPDEISAIQLDEPLKSSFPGGSIETMYQSSSYFEEYEYFLIEIPFGFMADDWDHIQNIQLHVQFELNGKLPHISSIFPIDLSVRAGDVIREYLVYGNLSLSGSTPQLSFGGLPIAPQVDGKLQLSKKVIKKQEYDLLVPKVNAYHNGNNEVAWKFIIDELFPKNAQFKGIIIIGLPRGIDVNTLKSKFNLRVGAKHRADPKPITQDCMVKSR
jgi:hypothetical protein